MSSDQPLDIDAMHRRRKNPALAAAMNVLVPGAGYIYCGRVFLGIIAFPFVAGMLFYEPLAGFGLTLVMIVDGFLAAGRYNRRLDERIAAAMKTCPVCAEKVRPEATACRHCGHPFDVSLPTSATAKAA
ncbi:MAG: zinc ribbon domain-containing protein [Myxococcales bacterium FL481]|nr:MAG: zinc ribbon domain-containing protein [Myxococcales bacterium FL481]